MIKFHPDPEQLSQYVQGGLAPIDSVIISAHCDMCERCSKVIHQQTLILAENFEAETGVPNDLEANASTNLDFNAMFDRIVNQSQINQSKRLKPPPTSIELDGRRFILPKTLRKFIPATGSWTSLVGRLWQAPVHLGNDAVSASLLYFGFGGGIPEHSHRGAETSLVIKGTYEDGINQYQAGDFVCMNSSDTHTPVCHSAQGCLIFAVLEQPLHFTSGVARLTNPLSHVFFR